jgi:hypothetical protein
MELFDFATGQKIRRPIMKLKLPTTARLHYSYFPPAEEGIETVNWFAVREMTTGIKAEYNDLSADIKIRRDEDGVTESREYPSGTRQWERCRLMCAEWNLTDEEGNAVPVCYEAWRQLPPEWSQAIDDMLFKINPEMLGDPARKNRKELVEGEVNPPTLSPAPPVPSNAGVKSTQTLSLQS